MFEAVPQVFSLISVELPVPLNAWLQAFIVWLPLVIFKFLEIPDCEAPNAFPVPGVTPDVFTTRVGIVADPVTAVDGGMKVPAITPAPGVVAPTDFTVMGRLKFSPLMLPDSETLFAEPVMFVLLFPVPFKVITLAIFPVAVEQLPVSALDQAGLTHEAGESAIVGIAQ